MYFLSFLFLALEFYSVMLSVFFELLNLWAERKDIDMNSKVYTSKKLLDPFEAISVDDLPSRENK